MLLNSVVIPSVREIKYLRKACEVDSPIVFISDTNIGNLMSQVEFVHKHGKKVFADLELIGGFKPDSTGMKLLKNMYHLDGIFTTNVNAARMANALGIIVVYRLFMIDSRSLKRSANILRNNHFDTIEVLPAECGVQEIEQLTKMNDKHNYIAGGFIRDKAMIKEIFDVGISAVTTSKVDLWE
ncbi:glycerol-3-phosphate responsive antiterminator [Companilactobacillus huachuanensis]|uniref:Glycerol uptake operon antiterminator regulatory protein n=1 Tax=Companilactobacillus huachuanensis TaxID=2559914 RepID=A0ABW1RQS0_9LACO|nr:glycerol-3-phosphate responsive antiterminator [Companilactobacillus huachuanensis]